MLIYGKNSFLTEVTLKGWLGSYKQHVTVIWRTLKNVGKSVKRNHYSQKDGEQKALQQTWELASKISDFLTFCLNPFPTLV